MPEIPASRPIILSHRHVTERDEINPDTLQQEISLALASLEHDAEARGIACDWETFRFRLTNESPTLLRGMTLVLAEVAVLP